MKTLKSFVVAFSLVLVPSLSEAGWLDAVVLPVLRRTTATGGGAGGLFGGRGHNQIFRHTLPYAQFVHGYATYNGGDNEDENLDEEVLEPGQQLPAAHRVELQIEEVNVDPYCPRQAGWPAQVAAGELHHPHGGSIFSDMLLDLYRADQYEDDDHEVVVEVHQTVEIAESRLNDPWVQQYLRGEILIGTPPGMMGEQVLDLARSATFRVEYSEDDQDESIDQESDDDIISTVPADELDRLARMIWLNRWDLTMIRGNILAAIDRHTNSMTGYVNMDVLNETFVGMTIFHRLHDELWGQDDTFDMLSYKSMIEGGLSALQDYMDSRLLDD